MKYEIILIIKTGIVTEIYDETEMDLESFTSKMVSKYGIFIQQSIKQI
jgi:hypothetical protein